MNKLKKITILTCTHNRSAILKKCLNSIKDSSVFGQVSIQHIVVNNASADDTNETIIKFKSECKHELYELIHLNENKLGKSFALTLGVTKITGEYVIFLDDDNFFFPNTLKNILNLINEFPEHIIGSENIPQFECAPPAWFEQSAYFFACGKSEKYTELTGVLWGAGMIVPSFYIHKMFQSGFEFTTKCRQGKNIFGGTDSEICQCLKIMGLKIVTPIDYQILHYVPKERLNLRYLLKLAYSYGKTDPMLIGYKNFLKNYKNEECPPLANVQKEILNWIRWRLKSLIVGNRQGGRIDDLAGLVYKISYLASATINYESMQESYQKVMNACSKYYSWRSHNTSKI